MQCHIVYKLRAASLLSAAFASLPEFALSRRFQRRFVAHTGLPPDGNANSRAGTPVCTAARRAYTVNYSESDITCCGNHLKRNISDCLDVHAVGRHLKLKISDNLDNTLSSEYKIKFCIDFTLYIRA